VLRVCAITREPPARLPAGPTGGRLELLACGPLLVVAEAGAAELPATAEALSRHDATVRLLAEQVDALLPARFGWLATDPGGLAAQLEPHTERLREALELTSGREQMTLRILGPTDEVEGRGPEIEDGGPGAPATDLGAGTRYLRAKREAARRREEVPEIAPLRAALQPLVRAERAQRHPAPPDHQPGHPETLLASVYHLIDRGHAAEYRAAVDAAAAALAPRRVTVSGPFAPYAFAPEDLR
jgi:gas vesicle protein GvpL/GvpF